MTRQIRVGNVPIGGGAPVVIQSMLNTKTTDVEGSLRQIRELAAAGCQIARLAVPNMEAARGFAEICKESPLPLVADIHFDYKLAIAAAEGGAAKIRINPGNIGGEDRVKAVVDVCKSRHIPIRIGVNGGSLDKKLLEKYGHPTAEALVESAFQHLELLEKQGFYDTCVSMKSSTVPTMVAAARLFREKCDYPLHIGVTETGPVKQGLIKSAMGIGALLLDGIGDTIRVSLTDDPVQEVYAAKETSSPAPPAAGRRSTSSAWQAAWRKRCRTARSPSPWRSWAASSTAPAKPGRQTSASPAATDGVCSLKKGRRWSACLTRNCCRHC